MILKFDKYQGAGNDFIILNNLDGLFSKLSEHQFRKCAIVITGFADGIILLKLQIMLTLKWNITILMVSSVLSVEMGQGVPFCMLIKINNWLKNQI